MVPATPRAPACGSRSTTTSSPTSGRSSDRGAGPDTPAGAGSGSCVPARRRRRLGPAELGSLDPARSWTARASCRSRRASPAANGSTATSPSTTVRPLRGRTAAALEVFGRRFAGPRGDGRGRRPSVLPLRALPCSRAGPARLSRRAWRRPSRRRSAWARPTAARSSSLTRSRRSSRRRAGWWPRGAFRLALLAARPRVQPRHSRAGPPSLSRTALAAVALALSLLAKAELGAAAAAAILVAGLPQRSGFGSVSSAGGQRRDVGRGRRPCSRRPATRSRCAGSRSPPLASEGPLVRLFAAGGMAAGLSPHFGFRRSRRRARGSRPRSFSTW